MKTIRAQITDSDYDKLMSCISHHGEISHIIRKAIREYCKEKGRELRGSVTELTGLYSETGDHNATKRDEWKESRRRGGATKTKVSVGGGKSR